MADFHIVIVGTADEALVDDFVMKKTKKLIKDLNAGNVAVESASLSSGHFLGGSQNLVETVEVASEEIVDA